MKHYTDTIPLPLAEKLKAAGMPITMSNHLHQIAPNVRGVVQANFKEIDCPTYAEVFDWMMEERIYITIKRSVLPTTRYIGEVFRGTRFEYISEGDTWHEAAERAIDNALELI